MDCSICHHPAYGRYYFNGRLYSKCVNGHNWLEGSSVQGTQLAYLTIKEAWDADDKEMAAWPRSKMMRVYWLLNTKHGVRMTGLPDDIEREWKREQKKD